MKLYFISLDLFRKYANLAEKYSVNKFLPIPSPIIWNSFDTFVTHILWPVINLIVIIWTNLWVKRYCNNYVLNSSAKNTTSDYV